MPAHRLLNHYRTHYKSSCWPITNWAAEAHPMAVGRVLSRSDGIRLTDSGSLAGP